MLKYLGRSCEVMGVAGMLLVAAAYLDAFVGSRQALADFATASLEIPAPDQSQWSEKARREFADSRPQEGTPLALLSIERLGLKVPVFPGTDRLTLNRGAGVVAGTAYPDEVGNVVLSAHRDSYFRPLKDIALGDVVELTTLQTSEKYQVVEVFITDPLDLSVLDPSESKLLTLITCYPFYYVGFAPDRLIVRAAPVTTAGADPASISTQPMASLARSVGEMNANSTSEEEGPPVGFAD